ncbi:EF-hand domain-containing protein [Streptomyces sp. NPDC048290]|uniref:EF-hand domain-containing protein n=1 Tax=Streptomyces sp. NPDC048290 TaxID=3155811 RepID=UPI003429990D
MRTEAIQRVTLVFSLFDVNGNGVLDAEDFTLMNDRVAAAAPHAAQDAKDTMRAAFEEYWEALVTGYDTNGDGVISLEEFIACVLAPERFTPAVVAFADALVALGDPDGDGHVERADFTALMIAIGFRPANIDTLFDAFGPDERDSIAGATWHEGIKDFYGADKAGIAGDHLLTGTGF